MVGGRLIANSEEARLVSGDDKFGAIWLWLVLVPLTNYEFREVMSMWFCVQKKEVLCRSNDSFVECLEKHVHGNMIA